MRREEVFYENEKECSTAYYGILLKSDQNPSVESQS